MAFWITSRALWWRNAIYRKRRPIGSLLDFMLPIIGMALLLWLKSSADSTDSLKATYRDAKIRGNDDVIRPLTFGDWLLALKVSRTCFGTLPFLLSIHVVYGIVSYCTVLYCINPLKEIYLCSCFWCGLVIFTISTLFIFSSWYSKLCNGARFTWEGMVHK